ncbi:aspartyl protease family protein [Sphingomonas piscis]|nr:aspartyl protease family protein [Sphingomonas piscis]
MREKLFVIPLAVALSAGLGAAPVPKIRRPVEVPTTAGTMPSLPPAIVDPALTIGGDDVKARQAQSRLSVEVHVNGSGPYQFVVDSGADSSVIGLRIAQNLRLPLGTPVILNSMTGTSIVDRVHTSSLKLGPTTVSDLELPALREEDLGGQGLIGIDALVRRRLMMDFEQHKIKVEDASVPIKFVPGEIVVVGKRRRGQLILTHVKARSIELDAVIDTGSELTIGNLLLREKLVRRRTPLGRVEAIGVNGKKVDLDVAIIPELAIGPIVIRNLPVAFADLPPFKVFGIDRQPALFLGTDVLQRFRRVSLDFQARKVRFQLRKCEPADFTLVRTTSLGGSFPSTPASQSCG